MNVSIITCAGKIDYKNIQPVNSVYQPSQICNAKTEEG